MNNSGTQTARENGRARRPKETRKKPTRKDIIRRRKMLLAALIVVVILVIAAVVCIVTGVFDKKAQVSTLSFQKDGTIISEEVSSFDKDYYAKGELKSYTKDAIKEYTTEHGAKTIKYKKMSVSDDSAYLKLIYASAEDYGQFTGYGLYQGTIKEAQEAGLTFEDAFVAVKDGKKLDITPAEDVVANGDYKVIAIKQNVTVTVDGTICYVSDACTRVNDKNSVTISQPDGNEDATQLTYIIYK